MLPDQGTLTQIMIMTNILDGVKMPSQIAKNVGITIQGVQYHTKILKNKRLLTKDGSVSKLGYIFLESGLNSMRDFVSQNLSRLDEFATWEVIADEDIPTGSNVYVYMLDGYLHATRKKEGIKASVKNGSLKGQTALVSLTEGMIEVDFGTIIIAVLPDIADSEQTFKLTERVKDLSRSKKTLVAVVGEFAKTICLKAGIHVSIEFASLNASFEAAVRGVSTRLFVSERRFRYLLYDLKILQGKYREVKTEIVYLK